MLPREASFNRFSPERDAGELVMRVGSCCGEDAGLSPEDLLEIFVFTPISTISLVVFLVAFLVHLAWPRGQTPTLFYKESAFSRQLLSKIPALQQPYCPPFWAQGATLQTLLAAYVMPAADLRFQRQFLQLKDRGVVALDWPSADVRRTSPVLLVLPPLEADAVSVSWLCREAVRRGYRPVVFNRRGHGNSPLTTARLQPYGDPSDLRQTVKFLRCRLPGARLLALGLGSGADLLLAYLGEFGSSAFLAAAAVISPLYDPERLYTMGLPWPHAQLLMLSLRRLIAGHLEALRKTVDVEAALHSRSPADFERHVYWRMCSSDSADQYWEKNAPLRDADEMSVPLLCISSRDDPLVPDHVIPYDVFQVYPHMVLATTERGGHCGFIRDWSETSWAESVALDFLKVASDFAAEENPS